MNKSIKVKKVLENCIDKFNFKFKIRNKSKEKFLKKLEKDQFFLKELNKKVKSNSHFKKRNFKSIYELSVYRNFIYYVVRCLKPNKVLETGVFHGLTTMWILKALEDNQKGELFSIDIKRSDWNKYFKKTKMGPGYIYDLDFPKNENPGWIIPEYLKKRWTLIYGPSHRFMDKFRNIDLFIHDSDHSYKNEKNEIQTVTKNNKNIPFIIDNFDMNSYSFEYLNKNSPKDGYCNKNYVIIDDVSDNLECFESSIIIK